MASNQSVWKMLRAWLWIVCHPLTSRRIDQEIHYHLDHCPTVVSYTVLRTFEGFYVDIFVNDMSFESHSEVVQKELDLFRRHPQYVISFEVHYQPDSSK